MAVVTLPFRSRNLFKNLFKNLLRFIVNDSAIKIFDELASHDEQLCSHTLDCVMEDREAEIVQKYNKLVVQITRKFGKPDYSGRGPGWGCEVNELRRKIVGYGGMMEVSFWKKNNMIYAVMYTGHDANSLYSLSLATARE